MKDGSLILTVCWYFTAGPQSLVTALVSHQRQQASLQPLKIRRTPALGVTKYVPSISPLNIPIYELLFYFRQSQNYFGAVEIYNWIIHHLLL